MSATHNKEVLLDNFIDKEFQLVFLPLNVMSAMILQPKLQILHGFVTPNNKRIFFLNAILLLIVAMSIVYYVIAAEPGGYINKRNDEVIWADILPVVDFSYYSIGFISSFYNSSSQSSNLVQVVINIQKCHRIPKFTKDKSPMKLKMFTYSLLIFFLCFSIIHIFFSFMNTPLYYVFVYCLVLFFDVNLLYGLGVLRVLRFELDLWISELKEFNNVAVGSGDSTHCDRMLQAFADIMAAFRSYKKVFQVPILFHTSEIFLHSVSLFQLMIEIGTRGIRNILPGSFVPFFFIQISFWTFKNILLISAISMECQTFYISVAQAELYSLGILKTKMNKNHKTLCKNVVRMRMAWFRPLVACGVFSVDAGLLPRLLQLVTAYTIVLLQFAFT